MEFREWSDRLGRERREARDKSASETLGGKAAGVQSVSCARHRRTAPERLRGRVVCAAARDERKTCRDGVNRRAL
jgi:hypothetical protein